MATVLPIPQSKFAGLGQGIQNFLQARKQAQQNLSRQMFLQQAALQAGLGNMQAPTDPFSQQAFLGQINDARRFQQQQQLLQEKPASGSNLNALAKNKEIERLGERRRLGTITPTEDKSLTAMLGGGSAGPNIFINTQDLPQNVKEQLPALAGAQKKIIDFKADPNNAEILKDNDINVVTNAKGQLMLEVKPKAAAGDAQLKEFSDLLSLRDSAKSAQLMFDPSFVGLFEGSEFLNVIERATGLFTTPTEIDFKRIIKDLSDRLLRARSGAQINEQEFKRLTKIVPQLGTADEVFQVELVSFIRELEAIIETKRSLSGKAGKRGFDLPRGLARRQPVIEQPAGQAPLSKADPEFQNLIDELSGEPPAPATTTPAGEQVSGSKPLGIEAPRSGDTPPRGLLKFRRPDGKVFSTSLGGIRSFVKQGFRPVDPNIQVGINSQDRPIIVDGKEVQPGEMIVSLDGGRTWQALP